jgi:phosphoglycolate phosphatase
LRIESIVFDFDGTLAVLRLDFTEMKARIGSLAEKFTSAASSPTSLPILEWLACLEENIRLSDGDLAGDFKEQAFALIVEMETESARNGSLFPFTRPLLKKLLQNGIKTAIITRNCDAAVRLVFPDIGEYCSAFFARDHVPDPKPNPAHLIRALNAMHSVYATAVMVGDHPLDIQTGKAAGIRTAGVASGNVSREELIRTGADWVAGDCEELLDNLSGSGLLPWCLGSGPHS